MNVLNITPSNITPVVPGGSSIQAGVGFGGDNGLGFHSKQPVSTENQYAEATEHPKNSFESSESDSISTEPVQTFPKYLESPFTRYVTRPLSGGEFNFSYVPEDRSTMGRPLNPFWIRNDTWSMEHEADIFMEADSNFVAPRVDGITKQAPQEDRKAYIENEIQPQLSTQSPDITKSIPKAPLEAAAGSVTGTVAVDSVEPTPAENPTNPASEESSPSNQDIAPAEGKRNADPENNETSRPKKRGRPPKK
jgi:hypothetical protein